jgi:hypothetical protein
LLQVLSVGDDENFVGSRHLQETFKGYPQQTAAVSANIQELFGAALAAGGPEAGTKASSPTL